VCCIAGDDGAPAAVLAQGPAAPRAGGARAAPHAAQAWCASRHARRRVPKPQVGGGDGGVVREITRHACVERIDCAEIDGMVPEVRGVCVCANGVCFQRRQQQALLSQSACRRAQVSRTYFPDVAVGFADPRVRLNICDGLKFVEARLRRRGATRGARMCASRQPCRPPRAGCRAGLVRHHHRRLLRPGWACVRAVHQGARRRAGAAAWRGG
jgi:hypothetical protein